MNLNTHCGRLMPDPVDFEQVVVDHGGLLWRTAAVYEADPDLRQDLYQEILLAVWRALPRFRDEANVRTYLARVAHNRGVSHVDRAVRGRMAWAEDLEAVDLGPGPDKQAETADRSAALQAAIRRLPLGWQQAVTLTLEGFAPREVADVLGVSANVVSIRLTRAKRLLRAQLSDDREERT